MTHDTLGKPSGLFMCIKCCGQTACTCNLGIRGPGIVYIKDIQRFFKTAGVQKQVAAARRVAIPSEESK